MKTRELFTENKQEYKIYVDIDGVLSNFSQGISNMFQKMGHDGYVHDETKYKNDKKYQNKMWNTLNKYQDQGNLFWFELPVFSDAKDLWNYVKPHNPSILTASGIDDPKIKEQKKKWIAKHFGKNIPVIVTIKGKHKAKHATKQSILIDDNQDVIDAWEKAGGIGILHKSAKHTIKQLKKYNI